MEIYGRVRGAVLVEGKSERAVAQEFGIARETVRKIPRYSVPPGYRRAVFASRLLRATVFRHFLGFLELRWTSRRFTREV